MRFKLKFSLVLMFFVLGPKAPVASDLRVPNSCPFDEFIVYEFCIETSASVQVRRSGSFSIQQVDYMCELNRNDVEEKIKKEGCERNLLNYSRTKAIDRATSILINREQQ